MSVIFPIVKLSCYRDSEIIFVGGYVYYAPSSEAKKLNINTGDISVISCLKTSVKIYYTGHFTVSHKLDKAMPKNESARNVDL